MSRWPILAAAVAGMAAALSLAPAMARAEPRASEVRPGMSVRTLFLLRCAGCHGAEGAGASTAGVPDFRNSVGRLARDEGGRLYMLHVPGVVGSGLDDRQKAEVMNYILTRWGDGPPARPFTSEEVAHLREQSVPDVVALRRSLVRALAKKGVKVAEYPWP